MKLNNICKLNHVIGFLQGIQEVTQIQWVDRKNLEGALNEPIEMLKEIAEEEKE